MFDFRMAAGSPGAEEDGRHASAVTRSAHDVATAIHERMPDVPVKKLHKLLFYAQAHHLATFDEPLFEDSVSAWDMGPVVGRLWKAEKESRPVPDAGHLDEAQLNTVGYVLARYGRLSGRDLEILSHGQDPWKRADEYREPSGSVRIERDWMRDYFSRPDEDDVPRFDRAEIEAWLDGAFERLTDAGKPDDLTQIRTRLGEVA